MSASSIDDVVKRIPALVDADAHLVWRGRFMSVDFLLECGQRPFHLAVRDGRIAGLTAGPVLMRSFAFAIRADEEAWREHWAVLPKPGFHDLFALAKAGRARIEGDLAPLMANLQYVKDVLATPRQLGGGGRA